MKKIILALMLILMTAAPIFAKNTTVAQGLATTEKLIKYYTNLPQEPGVSISLDSNDIISEVQISYKDYVTRIYYDKFANQVKKVTKSYKDAGGDLQKLFNSNYRIQRIGNESVEYLSDGRIGKIFGKNVHYDSWNRHKVKAIGNESVDYYEDGRLLRILGSAIQYDSKNIAKMYDGHFISHYPDGSISEIFGKTVYYDISKVMLIFED